MRTFVLASLIALALGGPAAAVSPEEVRPSLSPARAAVEAGDWTGALRLLGPIIDAEPANADALNLAAFASRNLDRLDEAAALYDRALAADPDHLGALEYQGELFLRLGDRAAAEANLARLDALCGDCEERQELAAALAGS